MGRQRSEIVALERGRLDHVRQDSDQSQLLVDRRLDLADTELRVVQQVANAVNGFLVELDRRDDIVGDHKRRELTDVRVRIGIDQADIEVRRDFRQGG